MKAAEVAETVPETLVPIAVAAEWLSCSAATVVRLCEDDALPHHMIGKRRKFYRSEVLAYIQARRVVKHAAAPPPSGSAASSTPFALASSDFDAEVRATRRRKPGS